MPLVPLDTLPNDARAWVFAADPALDPARATQLMATVDAYLAGWKAHGSPLTVGRSLTEGRFLTVAVDQHTTGASGCSIDGLYRALQSVERGLGVSLVAGGRAFWRDAAGVVLGGTRDAFASAASRGEVTRATRVFDTTVNTLGDWRTKFDAPAGASWHEQLLPAATR